MQQELGIDPAGVVMNASHCHGIVCKDIKARTYGAIKQAVPERVCQAQAVSIRVAAYG